MVEDIRPEVERLDLPRDQIQTDVELRLREAGIRVLKDTERRSTPGKPYIYVSVTCLIGSGICAYSINVKLYEWVILARGLETLGAIWSNTSVGTVGRDNIRTIRESVGDQVDKFINDYLAANPKK